MGKDLSLQSTVASTKSHCIKLGQFQFKLPKLFHGNTKHLAL